MCVLSVSSDSDHANTYSACAPLPNVALRRRGRDVNYWQTNSFHNIPMFAQVERESPLSTLFLCSVVGAHLH
jgi:hypothetical protein